MVLVIVLHMMKKEIITIAAYDVRGDWYYENTPNTNKVYSNWWYLHGDLQEDIGYDKAIIIDAPEPLSADFIDKDNSKTYAKYYLKDGIYDVKVLGIDKPCIGYFWTTLEEFGNIIGKVPHMKGLVLYKDDPENKYALEKYNKKSSTL